MRKELRRSCVALVAGLALAAAVPVYSSLADAAPRPCPDGSPPPCKVPKPTTTTTQPPIVWTANVSVADLSGVPFDRYDTGGWSREGSPRYGTPSATVKWNNAEQTEGTIGLTSVYLPRNGNLAGFWLRELGREWLCRSTQSLEVPPSGRHITVLLGQPILTMGPDISAAAQGFVGEITPPPDGAQQVRIDTIDLTPQDGALSLVITGYLEADVPNWPDNINDDFTYVAKLHPAASGTVDPGTVVRFTTEPDYVFRLDNWGSDAEGPIGLKLRAAVEERFADAVNGQIAARADVQSFAAQGYTVSLRRVTTSPAGIEVLPSVCKIE
jgi:hypothetical protein